MNKVIVTISISFLMGFFGSCSLTSKVVSDSEVVANQVTLNSNKIKKDTLLTFKRTSCYGRCPVYDFTVFSDKTCVLDGKLFFVVEGVNYGVLSQVQYDKILSTIKEIKFFELKDVYDDLLVQDIPATYVTVNFKEQSKSIKSRYQSPAELRNFLTDLHELAKSVEWTKE